MTSVTFFTEGTRIIGFDAVGHSGYGEEGSDLICAAISSTVTLASAVFNDLLGLAASIRVDEANAAVSLRLPGGLSDECERTCQDLLAGMMLYYNNLQEQYPENIEVLDGADD